MIIVLIAVWLGLLWGLVKVGVFKRWRPWMTASPLVVWLVGFLMIFLPLNWTAPMGDTVITVGSVGVRPGVGGVVTEVAAKSWAPIKAGEVLFRLNDAIYKAALDKARAEHTLALDQLARKEELLSRGTVSEAEVDVLRADAEVAAASVVQAETDLADTRVRAPFDGIVPAVTLLPGNRVRANVPVLAFLDVADPIASLVLSQNQIRHVEIGQPVEAVFRAAPGRTFAGEVSGLYLSSAAAEYALDGSTPEPPAIADTTYVVTLDLDYDGVALPPGASGTGVVFTDQGRRFQVLQKITLRMNTWLNFF